MTRYITNLTFTDQGAREIKDSTRRAKDFAASAKEAGVTVEAQYWTSGTAGGVLILAAEKEGDIVRLLAELSALGYVRTESARALIAEEFDAMLRS
ncbi:MAG: GYD domain-containing protein [Verrucomicrobiales bacterium]